MVYLSIKLAKKKIHDPTEWCGFAILNIYKSRMTIGNTFMYLHSIDMRVFLTYNGG